MAAVGSTCRIEQLDAEVFRPSHQSLPCPNFVAFLSQSRWKCKVNGSNRWDYCVSFSPMNVGGHNLEVAFLPHSTAEVPSPTHLILRNVVLTGLSLLNKLNLHDVPVNPDEGGQLFVRSCIFIFDESEVVELLRKVTKEVTLLNKCSFVVSLVPLSRIISECRHEIRADIAGAQHQAAVRLQLADTPPHLLRFASAPDSFLDLRLQCATAIIAGRVVPAEKCVHVMGFKRWVPRFFCFDANTGSLFYGDSADCAEALRRSSGIAHHEANKHVVSLDQIKAHHHLTGAGWVVSHFILNVQSRDIELRKEQQTSGIWFDALYSLISAWHEMKASNSSFGNSQDVQLANYSAWATASLEQRLHSRAKQAHEAFVNRNQIAVIDGGSMKLVSLPSGHPQLIKSLSSDRKQVAGGIHFTPASVCSVHPVWGVIVTNVHVTSAADMFSYGDPVSVALTSLSSSIPSQAVALALSNAVRLRSKPCPDIKVNGPVVLFVFNSQPQRTGAKSSTCMLVLEGSSLTTQETISGQEQVSHMIYLSHCTGILPVFVRATRQGSVFKPRLDASDDRRPKNEQCYFKIANCRVILKSGVVLNAADVVVQTSHREARDQWIHNLYLAKKASVTVPPLLPSPPLRDALLPEGVRQPAQQSIKKPSPAHQHVKSDTDARHSRPPFALCVILPISNPIGFRRREQLFQETLARMLADCKVNPSLYIVSIRLNYKSNPTPGIRCWNVEKQQQQQYSDLQVETTPDDVLWSKENLINMAIKWVMGGSQFGRNVEVFAWVDADIEFLSKCWVEDTLNAARSLQSNGGGLVQMFEEAELLGPDNKPMYKINGFAKQHCGGVNYADRVNTDLQYWHPGFSFAGAASTQTLMMLAEFNGGVPLIERTLGGGDRHMAMGIIGKGAGTVPQAMSDDYRLSIMRWCDAAQRLSLGMAVVRGTIRHSWHGSFEDRKYVQRWDVLSQHQFKPSTHMALRHDGLVTWAADVPEDLKRMTLQYFRERNEDSTQRKRGDGLFETIGVKVPGSRAKTSKASEDSGDNGCDDGLTLAGLMGTFDGDFALGDDGKDDDHHRHQDKDHHHDHDDDHHHEDHDHHEPGFIGAFAGYA